MTPALAAARAAQRAARDHFKSCRTRYEWCPKCQWHEKNVNAQYARADAAEDAAEDAARRKRVTR